MKQSGLRKTDLYSAVSDEELDRIISEVHRRHPNDGYKLMRGHLNARVYEDYGIDWNGPHSLRGGIVSVPEVQLARELSDEEVAILPAPGVSVTDALRSYVETVQVLSRIIAD
ncbi:hypothetical protein L3Q82_003848 [Scortum barcoo]|uniref:Uncharacterized protein n=1 Tax=Scortum barcoo TaxID=214431 RepID=A0ACB8X6M6_9TELE|nr:hypothetical protein L3Q82_003848 [Scortum barcoo]